MAVKANEAGTPFPIWGTCLGHQLLQIIVTQAHFDDLLVPTDAVSHPSILKFTDAAPTSKVWAPLWEERPTLVDKLASPAWNISFENHEFGLPPAHYLRGSPYPQLAENFDVLSTTVDRKGVEYVSTIEHKKYPFFGVQWHPEVRGRMREGGGGRGKGVAGTGRRESAAGGGRAKKTKTKNTVPRLSFLLTPPPPPPPPPPALPHRKWPTNSPTAPSLSRTPP